MNITAYCGYQDVVANAMKRITNQYLLALGLTLIFIGSMWAIEKLFPDIGWYILTVAYIMILILFITFYYLTTSFRIGWTVLNFTVNFILWILEQVGLEKIFHDVWLYQESKIGVVILGGLLWATNKIILDGIFKLSNLKRPKISVLEQLIGK